MHVFCCVKATNTFQPVFLATIYGCHLRQPFVKPQEQLTLFIITLQEPFFVLSREFTNPPLLIFWHCFDRNLNGWKVYKHSHVEAFVFSILCCLFFIISSARRGVGTPLEGCRHQLICKRCVAWKSRLEKAGQLTGQTERTSDKASDCTSGRRTGSPLPECVWNSSTGS